MNILYSKACSLFFLFFSSFVLYTATSSAQEIASWEVGGLPGGSGVWGDNPFAANGTGINPNLTIGGLTRSVTPASGTAAGHAWGSNNFSTTGGTDTISFTITANSGFTASISGINAYNIRRSGQGPTTGQWQYKIGNNSFQNIGSPITWGSVTTSAGNPETAINLTSYTDLQNVASGTTITFQIVLSGATASSGTWYINSPSSPAGDDLAITGTVTQNVTPIILGTFTAEKVAGGALLQWNTKTEINSDHFEVEKSVDGKTFAPITTIPTKNIISGADYSYLDNTYKSGIAYYQLKLVDADNSFKLSSTVSLGKASTSNVSLKYTLVKDKVELNGIVNATDARIVNVSGTVAAHQTITSSNSQIDVSTLPAGIYFIQLSGSTQKNLKFVKQ